jgi:hypothetical protein
MSIWLRQELIVVLSVSAADYGVSSHVPNDDAVLLLRKQNIETVG